MKKSESKIPTHSSKRGQMKEGKYNFNINISFSGRALYTFIAVIILLLVGVGVYAFGTSSPSTFGHDLGEIDGLGALATQSTITESQISDLSHIISNSQITNGMDYSIGAHTVADGNHHDELTSVKWEQQTIGTGFGQYTQFRLCVIVESHTECSGWRR